MSKKNGTSYHVKIGNRYEDILVKDFNPTKKVDMRSVWIQKIQEIDFVIKNSQHGMTFLSQSGRFYLSVDQLKEKRKWLQYAYDKCCGKSTVNPNTRKRLENQTDLDRAFVRLRRIYLKCGITIDPANRISNQDEFENMGLEVEC